MHLKIENESNFDLKCIFLMHLQKIKKFCKERRRVKYKNIHIKIVEKQKPMSKNHR